MGLVELNSLHKHFFTLVSESYHMQCNDCGPSTMRLTTFINKAAQASLSGNTFDDAATGQGLVNYFTNGINCGALTMEEAAVTGITEEELKTRSFLQIVQNRIDRGES